VGLPGGGFEAGDRDLIRTALRESQEEIGVDPALVTVLGQLSTIYIRPSNNLVLPIVGWAGQRPAFLPDPREVALLIEASLLEFLDPANRRTEVWQLQSRTATVPLFGVQNQVIWGATAMILGELLALPALRQVPGLIQA
jgi:8-oxo-dGTP pyrophosphatase MutT (NUDIX family)